MDVVHHHAEPDGLLPQDDWMLQAVLVSRGGSRSFVPKQLHGAVLLIIHN